tara:strand:- start:86 stop:592 length:507 start_codon:yes stop_codon:yes gene_type:complete
MAVTITPDEITGLADITRPNFAMNETVSATCTVSSPDVCNVTNVTAALQAPANEPDLVITPGTTSVNIGGTIQDPFVDRFTYVDEGRSDLNQTPTTVERIINMPSDKIFFNLDQDNNVYVSRFFDITVQWESGPTGNLVAQTPATFVLELKIYNEWEGIRAFVSNYYS